MVNKKVFFLKPCAIFTSPELPNPHLMDHFTHQLADLLLEIEAQMRRIEDCIECRQCSERCPYNLDTPDLLKKMLADYLTFVEAA